MHRIHSPPTHPDVFRRIRQSTAPPRRPPLDLFGIPHPSPFGILLIELCRILHHHFNLSRTDLDVSPRMGIDAQKATPAHGNSIQGRCCTCRSSHSSRYGSFEGFHPLEWHAVHLCASQYPQALLPTTRYLPNSGAASSRDFLTLRDRMPCADRCGSKRVDALRKS